MGTTSPPELHRRHHPAHTHHCQYQRVHMLHDVSRQCLDNKRVDKEECFCIGLFLLIRVQVLQLPSAIVQYGITSTRFTISYR